jgi:carboxylate-amine ligase
MAAIARRVIAGTRMRGEYPQAQAPTAVEDLPLPTGPAQTMDSTDTDQLRAAFEGGEPTVGMEEELMLLDPETLDLSPRASEVLEAVAGDPRFKGELPAAQLELITDPCETVGDAVTQVLAAREALAEAAAPLRPAGAGAHPFAAPEGPLSDDPQYEFTRAEYGPVAQRLLVFGLHVHVKIAGAERALAVYNAMRSRLPELAALAANAPFHDGADTGFASIRPKLSELLPRQGVPPAFGDLEELTAALRFGAGAGTYPEARMWWWELRLHPVLGTLELRVPDQQTAVEESAAIAAVAHTLAVALAERHDAGEPLPVHPSWKIAENRWSAARHGLTGTLADLDSGTAAPTRGRVLALIESLGATAERLGCSAELEAARALAAHNGAERLRATARRGGLMAVAEELSERFLPQPG